MSGRASGRPDSRRAMARQAAAMDLDLVPQRKWEMPFIWWKRVIARGASPGTWNEAAREFMRSADAA